MEVTGLVRSFVEVLQRGLIGFSCSFILLQGARILRELNDLFMPLSRSFGFQDQLNS